MPQGLYVTALSDDFLFLLTGLQLLNFFKRKIDKQKSNEMSFQRHLRYAIQQQNKVESENSILLYKIALSGDSRNDILELL